jgi:hypothetical protein
MLQTVYVSLRAYNFAGLYTTVFSSGLGIDYSYPLPGYVHDGPVGNGTLSVNQQDIDYQVFQLLVQCLTVRRRVTRSQPIGEALAIRNQTSASTDGALALHQGWMTFSRSLMSGLPHPQRSRA